MRTATVAVEDRRFYTHSGVDYRASPAPSGRDVTSRKVVQGGSTLDAAARPQPLHRNTAAHVQPQGRRRPASRSSWPRSGRRSKILAAWLNNVYFGSNAYGIEAASEIYFSKHASELNLKEAALLAGLPQAPSTYDPFVDPKAALARRDEVLRAMLETGAINDYQYRRRDQRPEAPPPPGRLYSTIREPYFFNYVIDQLVAALRREHGAGGRAAGLHDDRPAPAARRASTRSRTR